MCERREKRCRAKEKIERNEVKQMEKRGSDNRENRGETGDDEEEGDGGGRCVAARCSLCLSESD